MKERVHYECIEPDGGYKKGDIIDAWPVDNPNDAYVLHKTEGRYVKADMNKWKLVDRWLTVLWENRE